MFGALEVDLAAGTALYLSTPAASYLDGRFVYANWDMEKLEAMRDEITKEDLLVSRIKYGSNLSTEIVSANLGDEIAKK